MCPDSVEELLRGSRIFLTGVSGFVGGALLQRILSSDPGPERVFVLMRGKRGAKPQERFDAIVSSPLFAGTSPDKLKRVQVIPGDMAERNLGISEEHRRLLITRCTLVFHCAAFISFAARLKTAIRINLQGTKEVLQLAKSMPNCKAMVHVSTSYANCTTDGTRVFEEKVYPSSIDPNEFLAMIAEMSTEELERKTSRLIEKHVCSYTFTKQLAENLLWKERGRVPLCIIRPSLVLSSWREPIPGWVDNINSAGLGVIVGILKGIFSTIHADAGCVQDIIPVDMTVSMILAAAIYTARHPDEPRVYHCTSGTVNPTTWGKYGECVTRACRRHACEYVYWYPNARTRRGWRHTVVLYCFHIFPAHVFHLLARICGSRCGAELLQVQRKFAKGCWYSRFFSLNEFTFRNSNARVLLDLLPEKEREAHPMDPALIDWDAYYDNCVLGVRRYYLKEPAVPTKNATRRMQRLKIIASIRPVVNVILLCCLMFLAGCPVLVSLVVGTAIVAFLTWL